MRLAHDCTTRKACTIGVYVTRMKQRKNTNYCPYVCSVYVLSRIQKTGRKISSNTLHKYKRLLRLNYRWFKRVNSKYSKQTLLLLSPMPFENPIEFTLQTFRTVYSSYFPLNSVGTRTSTRVNLLNINHPRVEQCVL